MRTLIAGLLMITAAATAAQAAEVTGIAEIGKKYGFMSVILPDKTVKVCYKGKDINYKMGDVVKAEYTNDEKGVCTIKKVDVLEATGNDKPQIKLPKTDATSISVDKFNFLVANTKAFIVDVREPEEFKQGSIATAINIPMPELMNKIDYLIEQSEGRLIILQCNTSVRAELAAYMLQKAGLKAKFIRGDIVFNNDGSWKAQEKQKK